jgi:M6 family metalloprotease-like protein
LNSDLMKKLFSLILLTTILINQALGQTAELGKIVPSTPVSPYPITIQQKDGSYISVIGKGNQSNSWTETLDGYSVILNNGVYEYAAKSNGKLVPSGIKASDRKLRPNSETKFLEEIPKSLMSDLSDGNNSIRASQSLTGTASRSFPISGSRKTILLLIKYPDLPNTYSAATLKDMMNLPDYRGTGSFRDYYLKSSYGKLDVETDVFGWYTAAQPYAYYGKQNGDLRATQLVREAINAAEAAGIDFSKYDNDGNGSLDGVIIIHSGPGAEEGSQTQYIWSHRSQLVNVGYQVSYDNVYINDYIINPERRLFSGGIVGIGVFCHEFGHLLGLPDLYDISQASEGVGEWSLMGDGGWLGGEHSPGNLCAWSKAVLGWINPTVLSASGAYSLSAASENSQCYRVNTMLSNEYFLIENRQNIGLDIALPGSGLAIWHINSSRTTNEDVNFKLVDLEEADGLNQLDRKTNRGDNGDLFPGLSKNTAFDDFSDPNSKSYTSRNTGILIKDILIAADGTGSFKFENPSSQFTITSFFPATAATGGIVTITGSNLTLATAVIFGSTPAASFTVVSPTSIAAVVAGGSSGNVIVTNAGITKSISGFTYIPKPSITSFTPKSATVGTTVTLTGTNFAGATAVNFGGTRAASFKVISSTSITAVVGGSGSSGNISVTTPGGTAISSGFTYFANPPTITSFTPNVGCSNTVITITGTNFTGVTTVRFGGTAASSFKVESPTTITAILGLGTSGVISATSPAGKASSIDSITVNRVPIASITAGGPTTFCEGGNVVLTASAGSSYLWSTGATTKSITAESGGSYTVTIKNANNCSATSAATLVTVNPTPIATITAGGSTTFCEGRSVVLTANSGSSCLWSTGETTKSITVKITGLYKVTIWNGYGCPVTSAATSVTVNPVPTASILADGPTTFFTGDSVILTANSGEGYTYTWARNGVEITGRGGAIFSVYEGGSYTVSVRSKGCLAVSLPISITTIFNLPASNFTISLTAESCKTSNNGKINISAVQSLRYTAAISGNEKNSSYKFDKTVEIPDLSAGTYNVCITVEGHAEYQKSYDLVIEEPKDLSVYTVVNNDKNSITLRLDGAKLYQINLNGILYSTSQSDITLPLSGGTNKLRVSTGLECQGVFEKSINLSERVVVYPNPFENTLNINPGASLSKEIIIQLYTFQGKLVDKQQHINDHNTLQLELSTLQAGWYILKLTLDNSESYYKILKK